MTTNFDRKRVLTIALILFGLFTLLIAQFYKIQVIEGDKWLKQADRQHFFIVKEPFKRGTFFANNTVKKGHPEALQPFVVDLPKFHLYLDPEAIPPELRDAVANRLTTIIGLTSGERGTFRKQFDYKSRSRKLAMWLDRSTRNDIQSWWQTYARQNKLPPNALFFVGDYQRSYPYGKLLGQVLHTIQGNKDEITQQAMPTGGMELYLNSYLKGKLGKRRLMRSPRHALETEESLILPQHGADVYLTIHPSLQAIAEEEIEKGVKNAKARAGWAVMMDPRTGEILALAQYPFFNPSEYPRYFNDPLLIEHTRVKAIQDANEPGSIMKPITAAIALKANRELKARGEKELFSPDEKMSTASGRFPGRRKPISDTHLHKYLNMDMAIQHSSNIYVARLVERIIARMGNEWYRNQLSEVFGFGKKTNIELPAESSGLLPTPGKKHPNGTLEWSVPTPFSMAFGHNILVTSLQQMRAWAVLANGGYYVRPTLVRKIVKTDNAGVEHVILDNTRPERQQNFPRVMDEEIVKRVVQSMRYVTKKGGTARRADVPYYTEVGKTATANKIKGGAYSEKLYCSTFMGFTPVENPAFLLLVTLDEPEYAYIPGVGFNHHGGTTVAPLFREMAKRSLEYLGIPQDDPDNTIWVQDAIRLQEIYEKWNMSGKQ